MKELISILTAADEDFTLLERIVYGVACPIGLIALCAIGSLFD
jgi:hypothetical protein